MTENEDAGELVIGVVGPVGTDLGTTLSALDRKLERYGFASEHHRLSSFFEFEHIREVVSPIDSSSEYKRIKSAMDAGDQLRKHDGCQDNIMALLTVAQIRTLRSTETDQRRSLERTAHLIRSLKRPEEVATLRQIYGARFFLVSVYSSHEQRVAYLQRSHGMKRVEACELVERDDAGGSHGQATAKTFELADLFLDGSCAKQQVEQEIERFLDLIFGSPLVTPTADEHGMFAAFAASLRSGDLSRQVGAVVATPDGAIISDGANDAPSFGGGPYWPGQRDQRDLVRGYDSNERIKRRMVETILREFDALEEGEDPLDIARQRLAESGILDITEYGRAVHAEMAALMNCARLGVPTAGRWLYCTTFPCHNCAKHIVAAGIERVLFIEPYPKSRALELHADALKFGSSEDKVQFWPFVGVGPRRYVELFSLRDRHGQRVSRKGSTGEVVDWIAKDATPLLPDGVVSYLEREKAAHARVVRMWPEPSGHPGSEH